MNDPDDLAVLLAIAMAVIALAIGAALIAAGSRSNRDGA